MMAHTLAGYAKVAAKLLAIEMLVPGGTLVVLAMLFARRSSPAIAGKLAALFPFQSKDSRPARGDDLVGYYALRRVP